MNIDQTVPHSQRISIAKTLALLKNDGVEVTEKQAEAIRDFLYEIGDIVISHYLAPPDNTQSTPS